MSDYAGIKARLLAQQEELSRRLKVTQATEESEVREGSNSNAQLWEVSEVRDGLDAEASRQLDQVNDALARLDTGDYGVCESCGDPIGEARLEAVPFATLCIGCAEDREAEE